MITINYGTTPKDVYNTLAASDIAVKSGQYAAIKPNLVVACPPRDGATTHAEVVEGIIMYLRECGVSRIDIMESAAIGVDTKQAFRVCGYDELARKYGVNLVDLKDGKTARTARHGMEIEYCAAALETDFLINVPVLKAHCQTRLTCCLKNLKGCIPEREMRRFHTLGLHKPIAVLGTVIRPDFCVIDGICGDLSFEEGGTPTESNRIIAGSDPLLLDSYCAGLIGYNIEEIEYLRLAHEYGVGELYSEPLSKLQLSAEMRVEPSRNSALIQKFRKRSADTKITELNADKKVPLPPSWRLADRYSRYIEQKDACSTCYAAAVYALHKAGTQKTPPLFIGQGFKGKESKSGLGIGNCCAGFEKYVPGCPPKAVDIRKAIN